MSEPYTSACVQCRLSVGGGGGGGIMHGHCSHTHPVRFAVGVDGHNVLPNTCSHSYCLQRIAGHTRRGGPSRLNLERYVEALSEPSTHLTYPALTGARKQSVTDAERLFNPDLAAFMRQKGYSYEAQYIDAVWNWRRACDERGLSPLERCRFNYQFLNLILDELMPWHKQIYDFSLLEVNRCAHMCVWGGGGYMCVYVHMFGHA